MLVYCYVFVFAWKVLSKCWANIIKINGENSGHSPTLQHLSEFEKKNSLNFYLDPWCTIVLLCWEFCHMLHCKWYTNEYYVLLSATLMAPFLAPHFQSMTIKNNISSVKKFLVRPNTWGSRKENASWGRTSPIVVWVKWNVFGDHPTYRFCWWLKGIHNIYIVQPIT